MPLFIDQTGRTVTINGSPGRIISLVPSQTELLYDLGLREEIGGITKFCVHPEEWIKTKTKVGGTKNIKPAIIDRLKPDLILANKEENVREQVEMLAASYPVWVSDVNNRDDAFKMIEQAGVITGKMEPANELVVTIKEKFAALNFERPGASACYLIWKKPFMTVGGDTFISSMMELAGFENVFKETGRYPSIELEDIKNKNPQFILLSSEPFPFNKQHAEELKSYFTNSRILLVDGEMFSWYGSRMLYAPEYFLNLQRNGIH
jgi:ABC-type Fe3+-hydroxamate transport system substrate-binding protein